MAEAGKKPRQFRAEVRKVLHILTNSLYTNREIFLRELISNASDALDKLRFRINRGENPKLPDLPLEIRITLDKDAKTLTIADTGLGMTADELAENLGTIAKSGSEQFLADIAAENAAKAKSGNGRGDDSAEGEEAVADAANIIGRFGVGFYSIFMVANKVAVTSRPAFGNDDTAHTWASDGLGTYTVTTSDEAEPARGTVIKAWLKDDAVEFLEKFRVESAIRKHSAFVPFPVFVDGEQANTQPALWREPKFSITREQYAAFYKALTYDSADPLDELHFSVDAPVQFNALLFIPSSAQDFFGSDRDFWGLEMCIRDRVSGWRKDRKDNALKRNLPSRVANSIISKISGVHHNDYGCTLKAYRNNVIKDVRLYGEMHRFIPIYAAWQGARVTEIPVTHHAREFGSSKYGLERIFKVILDIFVIKFLDSYLTKPIYVFGGFGIAAFSLALLTLLWALSLKLFCGVSLIQTPLPLFSGITFLLGFMSILMGLLAEVLSRTYFESQHRRSYIVGQVLNLPDSSLKDR